VCCVGRLKGSMYLVNAKLVVRNAANSLPIERKGPGDPALSPSPPWCGGGVVLSPSPPVMWWGCGMLGMYGVYGRSGMACLESMVCLVCMVGMVCMA